MVSKNTIVNGGGGAEMNDLKEMTRVAENTYFSTQESPHDSIRAALYAVASLIRGEK